MSADGAPVLEFRGTRRFELLSCLGAGGMGVVYRALDRERGREVALKTVRRSQPEAILLFKSEFHALQDLAHPNLVALGELFFDEGHWFFTMELVEGVDFLAWVRPGGAPGAATSPAFDWSRATVPMAEAGGPDGPAQRPTSGSLDEARLRAGLVQLARGLIVLHDAGKVHRDIKPSNVLVTAAGRVVLLDFGLVADLQRPDEESHREVFGTTAYMAPEQAAAQPVGPESDLYSVGVVLYEALTGRRPFEGAPLEVLLNKQRFDPRPPHELADVPADLDALCVELLAFSRTRRPGGRELLRRLEGAPAPRRSERSSQTQVAPFVGRAAELALLEAAFAEAREAGGLTVVVRGVSGVGKSALVRRFTEALPAGTVVLAGRCYERESVPYKAFDGLIDALARYLRRLGKADCAALLPRRASLLPQVFPALARVEVFAEAPRTRGDVADPHELRSRVFAALRELLTRLAERQPLVLVIDDLQWADADSFALLGELTRPPDAPALLLVATLRAAASLPALTGAQRELVLERLSPDEARALATLLLERAAGPAGAGQAPAAIAEEADGHPLFIDELVRHAVAQRGARGTLRLDEALWVRVAELDPESRRLIELVAVAGMPLRHEIAAEASGIDGGAIDQRLALLRVANLVRSVRAHGAAAVEPYHDRVREAVLARMGEPARRERHRQLAAALEGRADPETLAVHKRGAGDLGAAARYAAQAADEAAAALAFDRAARLYRQALELMSVDPAEARSLQARLADALAAAGRGPEAAAAYQAAADHAPVAEALDRRRRAAEQLLISGHIDEGLVVLERVLADVGLSMPTTPRRTLVALLARRARLGVRGLGFRPRDGSQLTAEELTRIDICWSAAVGLGIVDTIRGADFQTRSLLLALRAGEPYRVARAIALEAGFVAAEGKRARATALLARAAELAPGHPHARGLVQTMAGLAAFFRGEWRAARRLADEAQATLREHCRGVTWERDNAHLTALWSTLYLGELAEVFRRGLDLLRDGRERGDHYLVTNLRTRLLALVHLAADDEAAARREVDEALGAWTTRGFHFQHFSRLALSVQIALYAGDGQRALAILAAEGPALRRSLLPRIIQVKVEIAHLGGASAIAAGRPGDALRAARVLARVRLPWTDALAALLRGGATRSVEELARAIAGLEGVEMGLYLTAARRRRGELLGDGAAVAGADAALAAHGVKDPERFARMLVPVSSS